MRMIPLPLVALTVSTAMAIACGDGTTPIDDTGMDTGNIEDVIDDVPVNQDIAEDHVGEVMIDTGSDTHDATGDVQPDQGFTYPDAEFIREHRNVAGGLPDSPFLQKFTQYFRTPDVLPSTDVRKVSTINGNVFLGTAGGLMFKAPEDSQFVKVWPAATTRDIGEEDTGILDIADLVMDDLTAAFITSTELVLVNLDTLAVSTWTIAGHEFTCVTINPYDELVYLGGPNGLYTFDAEASDGQATAVVNLVDGFEDVQINDLASMTENNEVYVATPDGLVVHAAENTTYTTENIGLPDNNVLSVRLCPGHLAVGTETGFMAAVTADNYQTIVAEIDGLPWGEVISIACDDEHFLLGHEMGATLLSTDFSHKEYFYGLRWMVDQTVYDSETEMSHLVGKRLPGVGIDGNGDLWLGGQFGLTRIYREERTFADKEVYFDSLVDNFWRMGGFFSSDGNTATAWDDLSEIHLRDKDNDGLWTQMMIGGWCFAYAATGDEKYYDYAHKAMQNMYKLIDYPWITFDEAGLEKGFISRSIIAEETDRMRCSGDFVNNGGSGGCPGPGEPCTVPCVDGWMNQYDYKVCCAEQVQKVDDEGVTRATHLRWNPIEVEGKKYVWKADTSSDEIAGHFFGFPIYYDLCAKDDAERELVASYTATLAGYIADNAMNLIDLDGTHTTFGTFGPDTIGIAVDGLEDCMMNGHSLEICMGEYYGGAWLNSNEGIGLLLAAWHMTGDKYFYDVYENLITEHKYYKLLVPSNDTLTIVNRSIQNHSDSELAMLAYTTVLRYEPNEERFNDWLAGFEFLYDWERPERNPWWAAVAAISGMENPDIENAHRTLREIPDDLREWLMDNCHRKDYEIDGAKDRHGDLQFTTVPPFGEIRAMWWNGNPYDCSEGGNGTSWNAPTVWLLPYYMSLYTGLITDAAE